jgi:hypothetical protein
MDDKTYVKMDFQQIPGHKFYVSRMRGNVPKQFKFVLHDKFAKKLLIWQGFVVAAVRAELTSFKAT